MKNLSFTGGAPIREPGQAGLASRFDHKMSMKDPSFDEPASQSGILFTDNSGINFGRVFAQVATILILMMILTTWGTVVSYETRAQYLLLIVAFLWLAYRWRSKEPLQLPKYFLAFAGLMFLQVLQVGRAPLPQYSIDVAVTNLLHILLLIILIDTADSLIASEVWENALLVVALFICALELLTVWLFYSSWWSFNPTLSGPPFRFRLSGSALGHANVIAGFLNLVWPLAVYRWLISTSAKKRLGWIMILAIFFSTMYFAYSRSGWLAMLATLLTLITVGHISVMKRGGATRKLVKPSTIFGGLFLVTASGFILYTVFAPPPPRTQHDPIMSSRGSLFENGLNIVQTAPILGKGTGSFAVEYARVAGVPPGWTAGHAHNAVLHLAAEGGLPAVMLSAAAVVMFFFMIIRSYKANADDNEKSFKIVVVLAILIGVGVNHVAEYLFGVPFYVVSFFVATISIVGLAPKTEFVFVAGRVFKPVCLALIGLLLIGLTFVLRGSDLYWEGLAQKEGPGSMEALCTAWAANPDLTIYGFQCGLALTNEAQRTQDVELLKRSVTTYHEALADDPFWPLHWANLASIEWQLGERQDALEHIRRANEMAPRNIRYAAQLGAMLEEIGETELARSEFERVLRLDPWLARSPFFNETDLRTSMAETLGKELLTGGGEQFLWQGIQLMEEGELNGAEEALYRALDVSPGDPRIFANLGLLMAKQGRDEDARWYLRTADFARNFDTRFYIVIAAGYDELGDFGTARAFEERALADHSGTDRSDQYYYLAYHRRFLPEDSSPFLLRPDLPGYEGPVRFGGDF